MGKKRNYLFIAISSIALLILLIIQVNWIFQTARIKEQLFNEKANMILSRTAEELSADKETCRNIEACISADSSSASASELGKNEMHKIDSLLKHYMDFYNFHMDYTFKVIRPTMMASENVSALTNYLFRDNQETYQKSLEEVVNEKGLELKLIFPEKKQFILAEMGTLFITSVVLINLVMLMFWRTILALMKEKRMLEHTTDFLNNMTHEFKTPLTNIALAGKMILKDSSVEHGDKIKRYSGIILEENEKLRHQVEQVLSLAALERGEIPLQKSELDFHQLIEEALKCISIQIENVKGMVVLNLDAENFVVMGDKSHLTNMMYNLIDNAIKYSTDSPAITIQTSNGSRKLIVTISDKGMGIQKAYHLKIFDKYFRIHTGDVHDVKGFGLGLAYIKKIVELHDGAISVESEIGRGTSFTIELPYV